MGWTKGGGRRAPERIRYCLHRRWDEHHLMSAIMHCCQTRTSDTLALLAAPLEGCPDQPSLRIPMMASEMLWTAPRPPSPFPPATRRPPSPSSPPSPPPLSSRVQPAAAHRLVFSLRSSSSSSRLSISYFLPAGLELARRAPPPSLLLPYTPSPRQSTRVS